MDDEAAFDFLNDYEPGCFAPPKKNKGSYPMRAKRPPEGDRFKPLAGSLLSFGYR